LLSLDLKIKQKININYNEVFLKRGNGRKAPTEIILKEKLSN
jgi:hypothetical protein